MLIIFTIILFSCAPKPRPVEFPVQGTNQVLFGVSRGAAGGSLDFSGSKRFEYRFAAAPAVSPPASIELEYSLTGDRQVVFEAGGRSWSLPREGAFGDVTHGVTHGVIRDVIHDVIHYAIPIDDSFSDSFSIVPVGGDAKPSKDTVSRMRIYALRFTERWYGFEYLQKAEENHLYATPFVYGRPDDPSGEPVRVIDPPVGFGVPAGFFPTLSAMPSATPSAMPSATPSAMPPEGGITVDIGNYRFEALPRLNRLNIPAGMVAPWGPSALSGNPASFRLGYAVIPPFPAPVTVDPGMVLAWPVERWRDRRYEVFRWEHFPSLLIFDTADYAVQDRLFKRLAFFAEKTGFRGRLPSDREIEELHGWNAHDYRAEDLARFFQTSRETNFPLLAEERELERILLGANIIRESGAGIQGGEGGVISISRESADYLRFRFMAHEGFHGLFFIDEDFRTFSRRRWQQLPAEARRFIVSYFNFQHYDTADEYLLVNEFMAHVLQQPPSQAGYYFGQMLPSRLEDTWRQMDLPAKDQASGSWPTLATAFTREVEAFSAYVNSRWGLAAGRIHLVTVRQP